MLACLDVVAHTCNLSAQEVEYHKFKVIFGYSVNSRPVWATGDLF